MLRTITASLLVATQASCWAAPSGGDPLPVSGSGSGPYAILIARARDCDSRLGFAHVFERPRRRFLFEGLLVLPDSRDAGMTPRSTLDGLELKLLPPDYGYPRMLRAFLRYSPLLVIYDQHRVLRMVLGAPLDLSSSERLIAWIAE